MLHIYYCINVTEWSVPNASFLAPWKFQEKTNFAVRCFLKDSITSCDNIIRNAVDNSVQLFTQSIKSSLQIEEKHFTQFGSFPVLCSGLFKKMNWNTFPLEEQSQISRRDTSLDHRLDRTEEINSSAALSVGIVLFLHYWCHSVCNLTVWQFISFLH